MIPARTPGAMLAEVHRRARRYRRRQVITAAALIGTVLLLAVVVIRLAGDGGDGNETAGTVTPPPLDVDVLDASDTGLPGGFVPRGVAGGPGGFVVTGASPGGSEPVWRSDDGQTWEPAGDGTFANTAPASVAATPERYLIGVTDAAGASPRFLVSDDGQSWTLAAQPGPGQDLASLQAAGTRFYRVDGAGIITSVDGSAWDTTTTESGAALPAGAILEPVGSGWVAIASAPGGVATGAWRSTDGVAFTAVTPPNMAPAGSAGGADRVVLARIGAPAPGCAPTATVPLTTVATTATATTATAATACEYPVGFAAFDAVTGETRADNRPVFSTGAPGVDIATLADGWLSLQRSGGELVVWSSGDGLTWARAADDALAVADGGPVVLGTRGDTVVVISDTSGTDQPPGVALMSPG